MPLPPQLQSELERIAGLVKTVTSIAGTDDQADTLTCLLSEALLACRRLFIAWVEEDPNSLQYAAFACRNMLELLVWTAYCANSKTNADRFREDRVRDKNGMAKALESLHDIRFKRAAEGQMSPSDLSIHDFKARLKELSAEAGIKELDTQFKDVREAAKEVGMGEMFSPINKLLSKYAHPTAVAVHSVYVSPEVTQLKCAFAVWGKILVLAAINIVKEHVEAQSRNGVDERSPK